MPKKLTTPVSFVVRQDTLEKIKNFSKASQMNDSQFMRLAIYEKLEQLSHKEARYDFYQNGRMKVAVLDQMVAQEVGKEIDLDFEDK